LKNQDKTGIIPLKINLLVRAENISCWERKIECVSSYMNFTLHFFCHGMVKVFLKEKEKLQWQEENEILKKKLW